MTRAAHDTLVVLFLRGGADGLNMVAPVGEDAYSRLRPGLRLAGPKEKGAAAADRALDLDGFFGLHPAMAPLLPLYHDGRLGFIHACGSGDRSRSHFEAMAAVEHGQADNTSGAASGWIGRHLASTTGENASPLRAVAFSSVMPDSLRGATSAMALDSLADFRLKVPGSAAREGALLRRLHQLYSGSDPIARAGRETLGALDAMERIDPARYAPERGAAYPEGDLAAGLKQVACLIKAGVGLEVACLDRGGWDTHVAQGGSTGWQATLLGDVSNCLAAFAQDLGPALDRVTVVMMTEFGRRVGENSGLGTDHGRGSVMTLLGGGVKGGRVHANWPGLAPDQLEGPGDLRVTTDYRDVLAEIVGKRLGNVHVDRVFPGRGGAAGFVRTIG